MDVHSTDVRKFEFEVYKDFFLAFLATFPQLFLKLNKYDNKCIL